MSENYSFDETILDNVLNTISGALSVAKKTTLKNGVDDAIVIASTEEANRLFGYETLKGKLISEIHKSEHAMRTRIYAWARFLGEEAPSSYPMCIQTAEGQHLWVQKEVEQRNINGNVLWITKNTLINQDQEHQMPVLKRQDELIYEFVRQRLLEPAHIARGSKSARSSIDNVNYYREEFKNVQAQTSQFSLVCVRCGHKWTPYVRSPKKCPKCRQVWYREKAWSRKKN